MLAVLHLQIILILDAVSKNFVGFEDLALKIYH